MKHSEIYNLYLLQKSENNINYRQITQLLKDYLKSKYSISDIQAEFIYHFSYTELIDNFEDLILTIDNPAKAFIEFRNLTQLK